MGEKGRQVLKAKNVERVRGVILLLFLNYSIIAIRHFSPGVSGHPTEMSSQMRMLTSSFI